MSLTAHQQSIYNFVRDLGITTPKEITKHFGSRGAATTAYKLARKGYLIIEDGHVSVTPNAVADMLSSSDDISQSQLPDPGTEASPLTFPILLLALSISVLALTIYNV